MFASSVGPPVQCVYLCAKKKTVDEIGRMCLHGARISRMSCCFSDEDDGHETMSKVVDGPDFGLWGKNS